MAEDELTFEREQVGPVLTEARRPRPSTPATNPVG